MKLKVVLYNEKINYAICYILYIKVYIKKKYLRFKKRLW